MRKLIIILILFSSVYAKTYVEVDDNGNIVKVYDTTTAVKGYDSTKSVRTGEAIEDKHNSVMFGEPRIINGKIYYIKPSLTRKRDITIYILDTTLDTTKKK